MPPTDDTLLQLLYLLFLLALLVGVIWLQISLSKRENKWAGLILPAISLLCSLVMVFAFALYEGMTNWDIFVALGMLFLLGNIPTLVLLAIYLAYRGKNRRSRELDKMNITDLE